MDASFVDGEYAYFLTPYCKKGDIEQGVMKEIKRRRFLKLSGLVAGGLAVFGSFKLLKDDIFNQKSSPSKELSQSAARGDINV